MDVASTTWSRPWSVLGFFPGYICTGTVILSLAIETLYPVSVLRLAFNVITFFAFSHFLCIGGCCSMRWLWRSSVSSLPYEIGYLAATRLHIFFRQQLFVVGSKSDCMVSRYNLDTISIQSRYNLDHAFLVEYQ